MSDEPEKLVRIRVPLSLYEKIGAVIESENTLSEHGPVSVADWIAWAASYCLEKQTRAIHAFRRSTFVCDGCGNSLRYTALAGYLKRQGETFCYCGDCWPTIKDAERHSPIEPKAKQIG